MIVDRDPRSDVTSTTLMLSDVPVRRTVRFSSHQAEAVVVRRLADLGLTIGAVATVVQSSSTAVILAVRGSRVAVGRRLADTIRVELEPDVGTEKP